MKYECPCCGYLTFPVPARDDGGYICPVCFWENDPFIDTNDEPSDCNGGLTLIEGQKNFVKYGACDKSMIEHVRPPQNDEIEGKKKRNHE